MFTTGSLFSGIGGFSLGLQKVGIKTLWANEIDPDACETYRHNFPKSKLIQKDIRELFVKQDNLERVDILSAGFPCQSFSRAGERKGFDDPRGKLFFEIIRILREFGENRPSILLFENVPYILHGKGGEWFETIRTEIQMAGYWFGDHNAEVLNTAEVTEVPQRRERLFMVALSTNSFKRNNFIFPKATQERIDLKNMLSLGENLEDRYFLPEDNRYYRLIMKHVEKGSPDSVYQLRKYFVREVGNGLCPTLTANMGTGGHNVPFILDNRRLRKLTEKECARLQGFQDDEFEFPESVSSHKRYLHLGNTVTVPVIQKIGQLLVDLLCKNKTGGYYEKQMAIS